ncbi:MAG: hypothetical protein A2Z42_03405 [Candidatus Woykebacteria bacterium RBG_19FT_COMBO_43_10]|uniref:Glycosyl transferase family 1 domain-containing protein n=1 Tax=Candidatus Woykebacteria bacterium RBG_19FT_COMBO_43_10 TaxID=1802598 RepID=A0A1G1WGH6_9BACT|nr:MAG: hypothetical protein A2Z42_03405 [Candidatus Woykebacteria bacterium RBG_19FT_COMBO_43_10]
MGLDLKILYILEYFPARSETFILNELRALKKLGAEPVIIQLSPYKDQIPLKRNEFKIYSLHSLKLLKIVKEIPNFLASLISKPNLYLPLILTVLPLYPKIGFRKATRALVFLPKISLIAKKESVNHIHAHFEGNPTLIAMLTSRITVLPYSFTVHGKSLFINPFLIKEKVQGAKFVVSISEFNKKYMVKKFNLKEFEEKIKIIHCGVSIQQLRKSGAEGQGKFLRILTVSRLAEKKGIDDILHSLRILNDLGVKYQYKIIGGGSYQQSLIKLVNKLGVYENVVFLGPTSTETVFEELSAADIFILTPKSKKTEIEEGIPVVMMEAGLAGLPVISSRLSGIPELIDHEQNGLLINQGDYKNLANLILRLWKKPGERKRLGNNLRRKVLNEFNLQKNVKVLLKNYAA